MSLLSEKGFFLISASLCFPAIEGKIKLEGDRCVAAWITTAFHILLSNPIVLFVKLPSLKYMFFKEDHNLNFYSTAIKFKSILLIRYSIYSG
jgi:hypothetical protein